MSTDDDVDTSSTAVRTYVPAYQKEEWEHHAERMDMSLSEFVRSMVQAGRHGFDGSSDDDSVGTSESPDADSSELEDQIVAELRERECCSWDELVTAVTDDIESELERTLQESSHVQHSPRRGGYVLEDA